MAVEKAEIEREKGSPLPCLFNPTQFRMAKANTWDADQVQGKSAPDLYFTTGGSGTLDLSLVFDTSESGKPVTTHTNALFELMEVDPDLPGFDSATGRGRPQWVRFRWGSFASFKAVVENLSVEFTYFGADGSPLRARVTLSLRQYEDDPGWVRQNPTSGTPNPARSHTVQPGEALDAITARYYGTGTDWRRIADANGIADPLHLEPGTVLVIPKKEQADASG
jgi:Contractile injection system tube protein/LysM domain